MTLGAPQKPVPRSCATKFELGTKNRPILAARGEMQRWKYLALEPSAMRKPDRFQAESRLTANGGHMPATLNRLAAKAADRGDEPGDVFAAVASRIAMLVPIAAIDVDV